MDYISVFIQSLICKKHGHIPVYKNKPPKGEGAERPKREDKSKTTEYNRVGEPRTGAWSCVAGRHMDLCTRRQEEKGPVEQGDLWLLGVHLDLFRKYLHL